MLNLIPQRKGAQVVEQFGDEDLTQWPFWAAGEGHLARGRAYALVGDKAKAQADFQASLELTSDRQQREQIIKNLKGNSEN